MKDLKLTLNTPPSTPPENQEVLCYLEKSGTYRILMFTRGYWVDQYNHPFPRPKYWMDLPKKGL